MVQSLVSCFLTISLICAFPNKQRKLTSILQISQRFSIRSSCYHVLSKSRFWITKVSYLLIACSLCCLMLSMESIKNENLRNPANSYDSNNILFLAASLVSVLIAVIVLKISSTLHTVFPVILALLIFHCIFLLIGALFSVVLTETSMCLRNVIGNICLTLLLTSFKTMSALFIEFMIDFMYPVREQTVYSICISTLFLPYIGRCFLSATTESPSIETAKIYALVAMVCAIFGTLVFLSLMQTENNRHKAYWSFRRHCTFRGPAKLVSCEEERLLRSSK